MVKFCLIKFFKLVNPNNWRVANHDNNAMVLHEIFGKVPYIPIYDGTFYKGCHRFNYDDNVITSKNYANISHVFIMYNNNIYYIPNEDVTIELIKWEYDPVILNELKNIHDSQLNFLKRINYRAAKKNDNVELPKRLVLVNSINSYIFVKNVFLMWLIKTILKVSIVFMKEDEYEYYC